MAIGNQFKRALVPPIMTKQEQKEMDMISEALDYLHSIIIFVLSTRY